MDSPAMGRIVVVVFLGTRFLYRLQHSIQEYPIRLEG